jgi:Ni2+-binding GTPase involved in maturation of urease and hydrogenase
VLIVEYLGDPGMETPLLLIGGFLGAGKTTLLSRAAQILGDRGLRVGIVTNDQSSNLVDTRLVRDAGAKAVAEVTGGCFCCRFSDLVDAATELRDQGADIILAEPVGSCTDLIATVMRPLRLYQAASFLPRPYTVLLDPTLSLSSMPESVQYLFRQQLLEADVIAVNKVDLVSEELVERKLREVSTATDGARLVRLSARSGFGVEEWLDFLMAGLPLLSRTVEVDYATYAEAEACLGWLNAGGILDHEAVFSPSAWIDAFLLSFRNGALGERAPVAHLKVLLEDDASCMKASVTGPGDTVSWDQRLLPAELRSARFILNARVNTSPEILESVARRSLQAASERIGIRCSVESWQCFSPAPPRPAHRLNAAGEAIDLATRG